MVGKVQRLLLGRPLRSVEAQDERLSQSRALGAFGLDALSSVAYGPDEIFYVLVLAGAVGTRFTLPVAVAIAALLAIVITSYRQTLFAYPNGGGSYTVARENLGTQAGLLAAAALMVDYLATVAVSVTAGVEAIVALAPGLDPYRVPLDVGCIVVLMLVNLRGVREAGAFFVLPTYIFLGSLAVLLCWGVLRLVSGDLPHLHARPLHAAEGVTLFLLLRAFAGGCTAMTGVDAQIGHAVAGGGPLFWLDQLSTALILLLAANTPFNGFPLLAAIMAQDWYLPRQFVHRGLRLSFSNGILVIGTLAIGLVVLFGGSTHALIPLYAVGVFLCFTLSQAGMVRHWLRVRGSKWRAKLAINGLGALTTGLVTAIVVIVKFPEGAWLIALIVPVLVALFVRIHRYYMQAGEEVR